MSLTISVQIWLPQSKQTPIVHGSRTLYVLTPSIDSNMYDSLMDHFVHGPCKIQQTQYQHDTEAARMPAISTGSTAVGSIEGTRQDMWAPSYREILVMITCAVASLVVALDATILVPVLPTLAVDLDGTAAEAFWTGTSYLLTHAVLQPFIATMSDIFGRRELLVPSILFFTAGSVACALAHNFAVLLLGRVIQGVGGAGIITLSQLIFADLVPLRQRPTYFSMVLGAWALGSLLGPLVGGAFVEKASWPWCFWLNLPICGVSLFMTVVFVKLTRPKTDLVDKLRSVDWVGNTLFVASLTSFLIAVSWAGIQYDWASLQTLLPLCLGAAGTLATIGYEFGFAKNPFLKRSIFSGRSLFASYIAALMQGLAVYMALYYISFYFSACHFFGPIRTGVSVFPATTFLLPGSVIVSALITRTGRFRWAVWAGYAISVLSCGLFNIWNDRTKTIVWAACECLFGLGMGMVLTSVNFSIQANVDPEDCGQAAAMYAFIRSIGMTLGVAVGGTTFQNFMKNKLQTTLDDVGQAAKIAKHAEGFIGQLQRMSTSGAEGMLRQDIMDGYVHGFRGVWIVMTALCGFALVISLLIERGSLDAVLVSKFRVEDKQ